MASALSIFYQWFSLDLICPKKQINPLKIRFKAAVIYFILSSICTKMWTFSESYCNSYLLCYNSLEKYQIQSRQKEQFWKNKNCSECDSSQLYQVAEVLPQKVWGLYFFHTAEIRVLVEKNTEINWKIACGIKLGYASQTFLREALKKQYEREELLTE